MLKLLSVVASIPVATFAGLPITQVPTTQAPATPLPTTGRLTVTALELQNTTGQVCFSLFDSGVDFPNNPEAIVDNKCVTATPAAEDQPLSVTFENLALGTYAVSILHDENEDSTMNVGMFGIPKEGFGFSRNPAIRTSAPDFSEAAIVVGSDTSTEIELIYY
jgi:uncharacterized protein (DUF2141 family)